jgi:hypothetical protein
MWATTFIFIISDKAITGYCGTEDATVKASGLFLSTALEKQVFLRLPLLPLTILQVVPLHSISVKIFFLE